MATKALINVAGMSRAGTTMLDLMLGNSDDAFSCGESYAWFRPWRSHHFEINCSCGESPCPVWESLAPVPESQFHHEILRQPEVHFVIDSAKDLNWYLDAVRWSRQQGRAVRTVAIWKDPINQAYSYWKRTRSTHIWRQEYLTYYKRFIRLGLPFVAVKHEDISAEPEKKLREICNAVGMEYFAGKERFWEKTHHHLFGSLGTRKQCQEGASKIRAVTPFDPEFIKDLDGLESRIARDDAVQTIVKAMEKNDVGLWGEHRKVDWDLESIDRLPAWYWARAAKGLFLRYFPRKAETHFR